MKFIHKNLTPFFWGPKATSRRGRQVELALCVRGAFTLRPGQPVEAIEDKLEQGFMSGDTWAEADVERLGPLTRSSDFADWKPFADVLLAGTAYPPKGADVACEVRLAVGEWSKTVRVVGPRVLRPGVLFGGAASDPQPFTKMPLTWENAYGGPGFAANPVGKGHKTLEQPTVLDPRQAKAPATFLPVSPLWPPRAGKVGTDYGEKWEQTRAPFVAEDFDWTFYNAAPLDQQLPKYLRGDEALVLENLHPEVPRWEARLPGLRLRALVRDDQGAVRDIVLPLDTLFIDANAGKLFLTWRGHVPARELDLTCVASVLIASEPLAEAPRPREHYVALLEEFEADPVGIKAKLPPGFLEVAQAIDAFEKAELTGAPRPDLKRLAATLPAGCPIPPWFLAAVEGDPDPLGLRAKMPPELFTNDPLKLRQRAPKLVGVDPQKLAATLKAGGRSPAGAAVALESAAKDLPDSLGNPLRQAAAQLRAEATAAKQAAKDPAAAQRLMEGLTQPQPDVAPPTAAAGLAGLNAKVAAALAPVVAAAPQAKGPADAAAAAVAARPSLDDLVARALAPLDGVTLPAAPVLPDVEAELAAKSAELAAQEQALRKQGIDHPLLGLFALGQRLIDKMPRPGDLTPDLSAIPAGLGRLEQALLAEGVAPAALGPLTRLKGRTDALLAALPARPAAPARRDLAYEDLRRKDLTGRDLRGKSLARAKLQGARLTGSALAGADLTEADLTQADLTGVDLQGVVARKATLKKALLAGANLSGANLSGADLTQADLTGANLVGANLVGALLQETTLVEADLSRANLTDAPLDGADLSQAKLVEARLEQARGEKVKLPGADLSRANLRFASLLKADLREGSLREADLSLAHVTKARADGLDLSGTRLDMTQLTGSRLARAKLNGARSSMGSFVGCDLSAADLREVTFEKVDLGQTCLDQADLRKATLRGCMLRDARATGARFEEADLGGSSATGKAAFLDCRFLLLRGRRAVFFDADLSRSDFSHADLRDAHFQGATGTSVNFFAANLKEACFRKANLSRSRFVRADLCGADLAESKLLDLQFTGANLYEAKFIGAQLASCDFLEANLTRSRFERAVGGPA